LRHEIVWSAVLGGCAHATCGTRDPHAVVIPQSAVALIEFLLDARPSAVTRAAPAARDVDAAGDALRGYAEVCWETRLRAPGVLRRLTGPPVLAPRT
jgi:hypothetical protein